MTESSISIESVIPNRREYTGNVVYVKDISGGEFAVPETDPKPFKRENPSAFANPNIKTELINKKQISVLNKPSEEEVSSKDFIAIETNAVNQLTDQTNKPSIENNAHNNSQVVYERQTERKPSDDITTDITIKKKIKMLKRNSKTNNSFDTRKQKLVDNDEFVFRNEWQEKGDLEVELVLYEENMY